VIEMGRECGTVEARGGRQCRALALVAGVVWLVLATASQATAAGGRQVEVSSTGTSPAVAYNAGSDEFLVVWAERGGEEPAVVGRRLDGKGTPIGQAFLIASGPGHSPAVAYDRRRQRYLVAWAAGLEIQGQRLSARGVTLGEAVVISQRPSGPTGEVALAYSAAADRYLVAWVVSFITGANVHGRQVDAAGMPLEDEVIVSSGCGVNAAASQREPRWLVAVAQFCALRELPGRISVASISAGGVESRMTISRPGIAPGGFRPGLAFAPGRNEYLAAWWAPDARMSPGGCPSGECPTVPGVYGQRLSPGGGQVGPDDFTISTQAPEAARATDVAVAYDRRSRRYLVLWEAVVADAPDTRTIEIFGQYLRPNGAEVPPDDFQISAMGALDVHATRPVVAARTRRGGHLVVWEREISLMVRQPDGVFARWLPRGP
jgi:hypothetical protein